VRKTEGYCLFGVTHSFLSVSNPSASPARHYATHGLAHYIHQIQLAGSKIVQCKLFNPEHNHSAAFSSMKERKKERKKELFLQFLKMLMEETRLQMLIVKTLQLS